MFPCNNLGESTSLYSTILTLIYVFMCLISVVAYDYVGPAYFIPQPDNVTFHARKTATLLCSVENLGNNTVVWRKASNPHPISAGQLVLIQDTRYAVKISEERREYNLEIHNIRKSDSGVYLCQVSTKEKLIRHILLTVLQSSADIQSPPSVMPEIILTGNEYVNSGDTIQLICNVTGYSDVPQDVDWFKDGVILKPSSSSRIDISTDTSIARKQLNSILKIKNSKLEDRGVYICRNTETIIASMKVNILKDEEKTPPGKRGTAGEAKSGQMCNTQWWTLFFSVFLTAIVTKSFIYLS